MMLQQKTRASPCGLRQAMRSGSLRIAFISAKLALRKLEAVKAFWEEEETDEPKMLGDISFPRLEQWR